MSVSINLLIKNSDQDNVIFKEYGIRPSEIAFSIAAVSNTDYDMGYIVIGAKYEKGSLVINGISRSIRMENIIQAAIKQLNCKVNTNYSMQSFNGSNVCIIEVETSEQTVTFGSNLSSRSITSLSVEEKTFIDKLFLACVKLQRNPLYNDASEDQRNDFIRDIIETGGYQIKDQTRQGLSATGTSTGEVDLLVQYNELPLCIIEALNLSSLDKNYLNLHLDKLYGYDTLGNKFNVVLSYVSIGNFGAFWDKYCTHIKNYSFPFQLIESNEIMLEGHDYGDIKYIRTIHDRNRTKTCLWHICVLIHSR